MCKYAAVMLALLYTAQISDMNAAYN